MEDLDIERLIRKISWGKSFVSISDNDYIVRHLSLKEQNYLDYLYDKELLICQDKDSCIITEAQLKEIYANDGIWTANDEKAIADLRKKIKEFSGKKNALKRNAKTLLEINKIDKNIKTLEKSLRELNNRKFDLFKDTAEARAEDIKRFYTVYYILEDMKEKPFFDSWESFKQFKQIDFINNVIIKYYSTCFMSDKIIRRIARNGLWRSRWEMSKNDISGLFGTKMPDITYDQHNLIYWSQAYDVVYSSHERPPKNVIEDDTKLDAWFADQNKKIEKSATEKHFKVGKILGPNQVGKQELFVVAKDRAEAADIQDLNDHATKAITKSERNKLKKANGLVSEYELRKGELIMQARSKGKD